MYVISWLVVQMMNPDTIGLNYMLSGRNNQRSKSKASVSAAYDYSDSVNKHVWDGMGTQPRAFQQ